MVKITDDNHAGWSSCRLTPWAASKGALLPDGSGDPRLVMDLYSYTDIYTTGTGFMITTIPALPYTALFKSTSGKVTLGGSNIQTTTASTSGGMYAITYESTTTDSWVPIAATKAASATAYEDTFYGSAKSYVSADKARITSQGWRIMYTGPANSCSGTVTVSSSPVRTDAIVPKNKGKMNQMSATNVVGRSLDCGVTPLRVLPVRINDVINHSGKDTITARPEVGLHGVVRHQTPVYNWVEVQEQPIAMINATSGKNVLSDDMTATASTVMDSSDKFTLASTVINGTLNFWDDSWDAVTINVAGLQSGSSFRFEMWTCVEYVPVTNSSHYDVARIVTTADTRLVDQTNRAAAARPIAAPSSQ